MRREWPRSANKGSTRPLDCLTAGNPGWEPRLVVRAADGPLIKFLYSATLNGEAGCALPDRDWPGRLARPGAAIRTQHGPNVSSSASAAASAGTLACAGCRLRRFPWPRLATHDPRMRRVTQKSVTLSHDGQDRLSPAAIAAVRPLGRTPHPAAPPADGDPAGNAYSLHFLPPRPPAPFGASRAQIPTVARTTRKEG